jgi:hypothetical protein
MEELMALNQPLVGDYDFCQHHLKDENPQFWRRALARIVTAFAEGMASAMKQYALRNLAATDTEKRQALAGEIYRVAKHGIVEKRRVRTPPLENICLAFRSYAELFGCAYPLDMQSDDWAAVTATFAIRHRVMHPAHPEDLEINEKEVRIVQTAFCYIINSMARLQAEACSKLSATGRPV